MNIDDEEVWNLYIESGVTYFTAASIVIEGSLVAAPAVSGLTRVAHVRAGARTS